MQDSAWQGRRVQDNEGQCRIKRAVQDTAGQCRTVQDKAGVQDSEGQYIICSTVQDKTETAGQ
jgi:hypothetical protein